MLLTLILVLCPQNPNVVHYELLVNAELKDLKGDNVRAVDKYKAAIERADHRACIQDQAIAEQRLAEHYFRCDNASEVGLEVLESSIDKFEKWGAYAKAWQLKEKYSAILQLGGLYSFSD